MDLSKRIGWWWPFKHAVIITSRPTFLSRDAQFRLHNETGQALSYPDGWGVWVWHGVRVPANVILQPNSITTSEINDEKNIEVRRVMIERYGTARYLCDTNATILSTDECGTLYCKEMTDDESIVMVHVINSTPELDGSKKEYFLRVPPDITTAREAVAWSFGLKAEDYVPKTET